MPLVGPWGWFYHIPKCGGISMVYFLRSKYRDQGYVANGPHAFPQEGDDLTDAWTMVRHPAEWLLSYYNYSFENDWQWDDRPPQIREQFIFAAGLFWPQWIKSVCENNPGAVGKIFGFYTVPGVRVHQLERIEQEFGQSIGRKNVAQFKPVMTDAQWAMICEAEKETLKRYGYDNKRR